MITANTTDRLTGVDHAGDRWVAHTIPDLTDGDTPHLITIRTPDGGAIHLTTSDAHTLYTWIGRALVNLGL